MADKKEWDWWQSIGEQGRLKAAVNHPNKTLEEIYIAENSEPPIPVNKSEGEGIENEAEELVEKFKPFAHGYETIASGRQLLQNAKQCALIHIEGLKKENLSLLEMAVLHMDNRAQLVLNNRLSHLNHLIKSITGL